MSRWIAATVLVVSGVVVGWSAIGPFGTAAPGPAPRPVGGHTIVPGVGLEGCGLRISLREVTKRFGKPSSENGHVHFARKGVEIEIEGGKVTAVFFHFRSREHFTFDGKTDKGIGMWSTIPDVIRAYGEPDHVGDSTVSASGSKPGAHEYSLEYKKLGVAFTFHDNELADVRVYPRAE